VDSFRLDGGMVGTCDHGNELSGSLNARKFVT
jgi:hypothetical protein